MMYIVTKIFLLQNYMVLWCTHKGSNIFGHKKSTAFPVPQYLSKQDNKCGKHQIEIHLENIT
jgi:hypothetical protein